MNNTVTFKINMKRLIRGGAGLGLSLLFLASCALLGPGMPNLAKDFTPEKLEFRSIVPEIHREVLPNGLVLLHHQKSNLPIVEAQVLVKAGAIRGSDELAGRANLCAALLDEGTSSRSSVQISEEIEFVGGSLYSSGGMEYSTAGVSVLTKDVELGFDLLSDILLRPAFPEREVERLKGETVASIIRSRDNPRSVASDTLREFLYGDHPYHRPVVGYEETVPKITRESILDFYSTYYLANNAILTIVGDLSLDEARDLAKRHFGEWKAGEVSEVEVPAVPAYPKIRLERVQMDLTQANVVWGHRGLARTDPDYTVTRVMNYILGGGGFASRMFNSIRDREGLAYSVYCIFSAAKHGGTYQGALQTKNESADQALKLVVEEMQQIQQEPVTEKELREAVSYYSGSLPRRQQTAAQLLALISAGEYYGLPQGYWERELELMQTLTPEDILRTARKHLDPAGLSIVVVGDEATTPISVAN